MVVITDRNVEVCFLIVEVKIRLFAMGLYL